MELRCQCPGTLEGASAIGVADWVSGPGGPEAAPRPPFRFVKENLDGTNPKIDVADSAGRNWVVKFGIGSPFGYVHSAVSIAVGYASTPTFFVPNGVIEDVHGLKRSKAFVAKDGLFATRASSSIRSTKCNGRGSTTPSRDRGVGGLKIMIMLMSNWDTKDARDGTGSNNAVYEEPHADRPSASWYAVTDWGASFGKSGGLFQTRPLGLARIRASIGAGSPALTADGGINGDSAENTVKILLPALAWQTCAGSFPSWSRITDEEL